MNLRKQNSSNESIRDRTGSLGTNRFARIKRNVRLNSRPSWSIQSLPPFAARGESSRECQNNLLGVFVTHEDSLFILISSLRPLNSWSAFPVLLRFVHWAPPIPHGRYCTNRRNPDAVRSCLDPSPWVIVRGPGGTSAIAVHPDSTIWCGRAVMYGIDQEQTRRLDTERAVGSDQMQNVGCRTGVLIDCLNFSFRKFMCDLIDQIQ
jgi:hypothetical protein